jgi:hypothetical protein
MTDLYETIYTNPIHVDECAPTPCIVSVATYSRIMPPFDTSLKIMFPWYSGTEEEFLNDIQDSGKNMIWLEAWIKYRTKNFIKLGYKDYLVPRASDSEISFIESFNLLQRGYGVEDRSFRSLWNLWRAEVQRPYWIYHTGICRYGCSLDTKSAKHSFEENLITKRYSELTGEVLNGYEVSVCGCGGSKCCNMNKIYIKGKGFFFKEDACKLKLLPPEHCPYTNCWQKHGMPAMYDIP